MVDKVILDYFFNSPQFISIEFSPISLVPRICGIKRKSLNTLEIIYIQ